MNEFEFIDHFRGLFKTRVPDDVTVPNGDDCGVFSGYVITMDSMVEGVHFRRDWMSALDIGFRAVASNLSDIAAMGAMPHSFLVNIAIPANEDPDFVSDIGRGMALLADAHDVYLMGGNVTASMAGISITITMIGRSGDNVLRRNGAKEGDFILISGPTGRADIGRMVLEHGLNAATYPESVNRFRRPVPRLDLVDAILGLSGVTACIDISDGLLADLGHLCQASKVGAILELDKVPLHREIVMYADETGTDPFMPVLTGGEEYELIITADPEAAQTLQEDSGLVCIGRIKGDSGMKATNNGHSVELPEIRGWQHL